VSTAPAFPRKRNKPALPAWAHGTFGFFRILHSRPAHSLRSVRKRGFDAAHSPAWLGVFWWRHDKKMLGLGFGQGLPGVRNPRPTSCAHRGQTEPPFYRTHFGYTLPGGRGTWCACLPLLKNTAGPAYTAVATGALGAFARDIRIYAISRWAGALGIAGLFDSDGFAREKKRR